MEPVNVQLDYYNQLTGHRTFFSANQQQLLLNEQAPNPACNGDASFSGVVVANLLPETGADHYEEIGDIYFHSMCSQTNRIRRETPHQTLIWKRSWKLLDVVIHGCSLIQRWSLWILGKPCLVNWDSSVSNMHCIISSLQSLLHSCSYLTNVKVQ